MSIIYVRHGVFFNSLILGITTKISNEIFHFKDVYALHYMPSCSIRTSLRIFLMLQLVSLTYLLIIIF